MEQLLHECSTFFFSKTHWTDTLVAVKPTACFLCVDCSDPAGHQDSARRAEMGSQSVRGRGEWELFFYRDTVYNLFFLLED